MTGLKETIDDLSRKVDNMENRQRRNNLIIYGLPEQDDETNADLVKAVKDEVFSVVGVILNSLERIHRLGKKAIYNPASYLSAL